jgi:hypothetical protein
MAYRTGDILLVYGMSPRDTLVLEIENAEFRHEWAKAEMRRAGNSRALIWYIVESLKELQTLRSGKKRPDQERRLNSS